MYSYQPQLTAEIRRLSEDPDENMLKQLRTLEMKMGLALTLVSFAILTYSAQEIIIS